MALDALVDSAALDNALAYTASRMRAKTGSSSLIPFDLEHGLGFGDAVDAIPTGGGGGGNNKVADMFPIPDEYSLPSNYQKLAYCEATGTQVFDTGVLATTNTKIEVAAHYMPGTYSNYLWLCGSSAPLVFVSQNGYNAVTYLRFGNSGEQHITSTKFYGIPVYSLSASELRIQNPGISDQSVSVSSATMPSGSDTIALLGRKNGNTFDKGAPSRFFRARIWENDVLVRWICPVLKDGSEICLYDVVNGTYMPNVGTGVLTGVM